MYIDSFLIKDFAVDTDNDIYSIDVPIGSKLVACKASPNGIHGWYEVSNLDVDFRQDRFIILRHRHEIPQGADFVTIIDLIIGEDAEQKLIVMPIYKLP